MDSSRRHIPGFVVYDLKSRLNPADSARCINSAFDEDTVSELTKQSFSACFRPRDHVITARSWSSGASVINDEGLCRVVMENLQQTKCQLAKTFGSYAINHICLKT